MEYEWEEKLKPFASEENREKLRQIVIKKIRKGQIVKRSVVIGDFFFVALLFLLIGILNVFNLKIDLRVGLINGIIGLKLAIATFYSPIQISSITKHEFDSILGKHVTADLIEEINKTIERKTSRIEKWLGFFSCCGFLGVGILKGIN